MVNIYDARDSHDGPVHQCMRRDIVRVFFRGSGIRMQKIPLLDWFYAINQDDNLLIFLLRRISLAVFTEIAVFCFF
ncbi:hypothetical protein F7F15_25685 [Escherichia coli]|nr:hypothetical protein F7F15_25685 [Escherichia coli]